MLKAIELSKEYDDGVLALDNLNLHIAPGEIYCLLGANGAGKTTTINLFLNLISPTAGVVEIDGIDVDRNPLEAKKHIGYLPENVTLYRALTGAQNLRFFGRLYGRDELSDDDLRQSLDRVGLEHSVLDRRVREYSKGMRQRLAIAAVLLKDASALLLDEPMSGLDPEAAAQFVQLLRNCREQGKAVLMSTHDVFRAKELADRVGIMLKGRKVAEHTRETMADEDMEALYLDYMRGQAPAAS